MTDAMILYARYILKEPHLNRWYQTFGYQDMIGKQALRGWHCLICDEHWYRTYEPDPKLKGQPPATIKALFYSALTHHKEAHSRDALEHKASLPKEATGPFKPAQETQIGVTADAAPGERGQPGNKAGGSVQSEALASQGSGRGSLHTSSEDRAGQNTASSDTPTQAQSEPPADCQPGQHKGPVEYEAGPDPQSPGIWREGFYCKDCGERVG